MNSFLRSVVCSVVFAFPHFVFSMDAGLDLERANIIVAQQEAARSRLLAMGCTAGIADAVIRAKGKGIGPVMQAIIDEAQTTGLPHHIAPTADSVVLIKDGLGVIMNWNLPINEPLGSLCAAFRDCSEAMGSLPYIPESPLSREAHLLANLATAPDSPMKTALTTAFTYLMHPPLQRILGHYLRSSSIGEPVLISNLANALLLVRDAEPLVAELTHDHANTLISTGEGIEARVLRIEAEDAQLGADNARPGLVLVDAVKYYILSELLDAYRPR